jgi:hypothetical protein
MKKIYLLFFIGCFHLLNAQNYSNGNLLGTWKLQSIDGKKLSAGITMDLIVEPDKMLISNDFDEINCSWTFSENRKYIYCSNEKSDEDWLLLELTDTKLLFVDKGKKMEFLKTAKYKKPIQKDPYANLSNTDIIDSEKYLIGDWKLIKINEKMLGKDEISLSFRPKGALYWNFWGMPSSATWSLNEDKKSMLVTAYNGQSEQWIIHSFKTNELKCYVADKYYYFIKN